MRMSDWSSDVCASDLMEPIAAVGVEAIRRWMGQLDSGPAGRAAASSRTLPESLSSGVEAMENLRIDGSRLWDSLLEMATLGATEKGGVCRLTPTDLARQRRDLLLPWCEEAGCTVDVHAFGTNYPPRPAADTH